MSILQLLIMFLIVFSGWPIGLFIASKTKEELKAGKKWFKTAITSCLVIVFASIFILKGDEMLLSVSAFTFMLMLFSAALKKAG